MDALLRFGLGPHDVSAADSSMGPESARDVVPAREVLAEAARNASSMVSNVLRTHYLPHIIASGNSFSCKIETFDIAISERAQLGTHTEHNY